MPTIRGWALTLAGAAIWGAGLAFGSEPMETLGFSLVALVFIAMAVVRLGRHDVELDRRLAPARANAHQPITVTVTAKNKGRGSAPLLLLEDKLPYGISGRARFAVNGIEPHGVRETTYKIEAAGRGRYDVGPLDVLVSDPFGLARIKTRGLDPSQLLIHPRIEKLSLLRDLGERRSAAASALRQPTGPRGEDFYTLREYAEGDELRKIHWPSTARRGTLMIRQEETPWHMRATILVDDRRIAHEGEGPHSSFEHAIEGAASVVDLYHRSGYGYRIAAAHHDGILTAKGSHHYNHCLDMLAMVQVRGPRSEEDGSLLSRLGDIEKRGGAEETLVVLTGSLDEKAVNALARCQRLYKQVVVATWPAHRFGTAPTKSRWAGETQTVNLATVLARTGVRVLVLGPGERLSQAWSSTSTKFRGGDRSWAQKPELV